SPSLRDALPISPAAWSSDLPGIHTVDSSSVAIPGASTLFASPGLAPIAGSSDLPGIHSVDSSSVAIPGASAIATSSNLLPQPGGPSRSRGRWPLRRSCVFPQFVEECAGSPQIQSLESFGERLINIAQQSARLLALATRTPECGEGVGGAELEGALVARAGEVEGGGEAAFGGVGGRGAEKLGVEAIKLCFPVVLVHTL